MGTSAVSRHIFKLMVLVSNFPLSAPLRAARSLCHHAITHTPTHQEEPTFGVIEPVTLIPAVFIVLAASVVKSTVGFGFAMMAIPFLVLMWEPRQAISILVPLAALLDALIVVQGKRHLDWRRVLPMVLAGALGIPLGNYVLLVMPQRALKPAISGIVLAFAFLLLAGNTLAIRRERLAGGIAGFSSGFLLTSTSLSGPP